MRPPGDSLTRRITPRIRGLAPSLPTPRSIAAKGLVGAVVWWYGMSMVKVTYSLDDATVRRIRAVSARLGIPQSQMVREAVADYAARKDRLSEAERLRMLEVLERIRDSPPSRSREEVDAELKEIREARKRAWRSKS